MAGLVENDGSRTACKKVEKNKGCPEYGTAERDLNIMEEEELFTVPWRINSASFNCNP